MIINRIRPEKMVIITLIVGLFLSLATSYSSAAPIVSTVPDITNPSFNQSVVVSVNIDLSAVSDSIGAYSMEISWDPAVLGYVNVTGGTSTGFTILNKNDLNAGSGSLLISNFYTAGNSGLLNVAQITYTAVGSANDSTLIVPTVTTLCSYWDFKDLTPALAIQSGKITIPEASITVTSPNGGEDWIRRTEHSITWNSNTSINVKIEYSTDNGLNWTVITSSISASSGTYSWTVANIASSTCLVKITDTADSAVTDQSDSLFTISSGDIWGDVNDDYIVDIDDALQISTYDIDPDNPALDSILTNINQRGNVNADSFINITDALICCSYELYPGNPNLPPRVGNPVGAVPKYTICNEIHSYTYAIPIISVKPAGNGYYTVETSVGTQNSDVFIGAASILVKWNSNTYQYRCIEHLQENTVTNCKMISDGELRMARFDVNGDKTLNFPIIHLQKINDSDSDMFVLEILTASDAVTFQPFSPDKRIMVNLSDANETPQEFTLHQNIPNPFNSSTTIKYSIPYPSHIILDIYNVQGQKIRTLQKSFVTARIHTVIWDGTDNDSIPVSSGVYFYQLATPGSTTKKQMLLLR